MEKGTRSILDWVLSSEETTTSRNLGALLLRLGFGLSMAVSHGRGTLEGLLAGEGARFPDPLGFGGTASMALMAFAELFCALAVAFGLLTRLAALPLVFGLGIAFFLFHAHDPFHEKELAYLYLLAFGCVLVLGSGRFSLDHWLASWRARTADTKGRAVAAWLLLIALTAVPAAGDSVLAGDLPRENGRPLEEIAGLESLYGVLDTSDGTRLRTILTKPENREGPFPAILFVQWLSCDTVELPASMDHGWARMMRGVAARSGWAMMRTEKAGVGDSEGPACAELDYLTELQHHREALASLARSPLVDPTKIVVFGASMGATMAPLVAEGHQLAGIVVWGGGAKTWLERTLGFERRFRELSQISATQLTADMKVISEFLTEYLAREKTPAEISVSNPELGRGWELLVGAEGETQYGRSVRFHQQAQSQDWASAWSRIRVPVLVLYGEYDWYEDAAGHALIIDLVNRNRPGLSRLEIFPRLDHHFDRFERPQDAVSGSGTPDAEPVVVEILSWLRELAARGEAP